MRHFQTLFPGLQLGCGARLYADFQALASDAVLPAVTESVTALAVTTQVRRCNTLILPVHA